MFVDLVKRGVLTFVAEIRRCRNDSCCCYCLVIGRTVNMGIVLVI